MKWDNEESLENHQNNNYNKSSNQRDDQNGSSANGAMYVKVMTDEQLETLRKQIAVYATICEQLVEMHKSLSAHQDLAGYLISHPSFSLLFVGTLFLLLLNVKAHVCL